LSRVQEIHENNIIHRDIKPENFLVGRQGSASANSIHVVDFGMAKLYRDPMTKQHIPYRERKSHTGTARYMSTNAHLRREQSRRDDLEALGHVLIYFLLGSLPWQGLKATTNEQKYVKIGEMKQRMPVEYICDGLPSRFHYLRFHRTWLTRIEEFTKYLSYVRSLGFEDAPDYDYLRGLLTKALRNAGKLEDNEYDWVDLNDGRGQEMISVKSMALPQAHLPYVHHDTPTAVALHEQVRLPAKQNHRFDPLSDPTTTRFVPVRERDQTASCQAQFQQSQLNLDQTQHCAHSSQSINAHRLRRGQEPGTEGFMQRLSRLLCCNCSR
jgi:casein kinase 1